MTCERCRKEIIGSYVSFKRVGSQEYMSFHVENGYDRMDSCWGLWITQNLRLSCETHFASAGD